MKRTALVVLAVCLFALSACGASPAAQATQTAVAATTVAAGWTATPTLTATPLPTNTPRPTSTHTPRPSATFTPSPRPSPQPTRTPADGRYVETTGRFSYLPPIGWLLADFAGLKYKIAYGTPIGDFAPNLVLVDEAYTGLMADYVALNIEAIHKVTTDLEIISQEAFTLTLRLPAVKLVTEHTQNDRRVRQSFYFFEGWSRKIVVTYTRPAAAGESNDALVDASMQSFQLISQEHPTAVPTTSGIGQPCPDPCADTTVLNFAFPFEPSAPGYLVKVDSADFSADVLCLLEKGATTGQAVDLNDNSFVYGVCDTTSLTFNGVLKTEVTVTVIMGGVPVVDAVTRAPNTITDYSTNRSCHSSSCVVVAYDFTGGPVDAGPTG